MSFKKILLAIDDSKTTPHILSQGLEVAKAHQADLMLFRCIPIKSLPEVNFLPYEMGLRLEEFTYNYQEEQEKLSRLTEETLKKIKNECEIATNHQLKIEYQYAIGDPGVCICETAQNWSASMIVIGRKGHSMLVEVLLGSVSSYVIHHAHCAVLVISPNQVSP